MAPFRELPVFRKNKQTHRASKTDLLRQISPLRHITFSLLSLCTIYGYIQTTNCTHGGNLMKFYLSSSLEVEETCSFSSEVNCSVLCKRNNGRDFSYVLFYVTSMIIFKALYLNNYRSYIIIDFRI